MDKRKSRIKKEESVWDKRKIVFFTIIIIILLILGYSFKNSILGNSYKLPTQKASGNVPALNFKKNVSDQINLLKEEASNINLVDVATSSPQVQKVINDLKAMKDYPNNQLKQTCVNLCSKL